MGVYVDKLFKHPWRGGVREWCHLTADTEDELHEFAAKLGLKRSWFQPGPPASMPHYDITANKRRLAVEELGAVEISREEMSALLRAYRSSQKST